MSNQVNAQAAGRGGVSELYIYCDGSYLPNDDCGGWAALLVFNGNRKTVSGGCKYSTPHRMEVMAAVQGLSAVKAHYTGAVVMVSDSQYLIDRMNRGRHWLRVDEPELFERLDVLCKRFSEVRWEWVKGHSRHEENVLVDRVARARAFQVFNGTRRQVQW